jgi:hypothetical protein
VEQFKYLGTTLTNRNSIQEEIKSRLNSGNACYHSVQHLLSSSLLFKNTKIKIYRSIVLPVFLYGCETWSLTLREEHRLRVFENRMLRRIFGPKRDEVASGGAYGNLGLLAYCFILFKWRLSTPYKLAPRVSARLARPIIRPCPNFGKEFYNYFYYKPKLWEGEFSICSQIIGRGFPNCVFCLNCGKVYCLEIVGRSFRRCIL